MRVICLLFIALTGWAFAATAPEKGERIILLGNGLGERMLDHPWLETELHLRYPEHELVLRNMCRPGNTPGFRPHPSRNSQWAFPGADKFRPDLKSHAGRGQHPTPDEWLKTFEADTIIAFFGYNESFDGPDGLEAFKGELEAFIAHTKAQKYNGKEAPRLVLVSPIAFENLTPERDLPDGKEENANLALYTKAMAEVAGKHDVEFVNVFDSTLKLYQTLEEPFTRNGFLPSDSGYRKLGPVLTNEIFGKADYKAKVDAEKLAELIRDKNWFWFNDYRMLNGVHVDGRRYNPFGPKNYPYETEKMRAMTKVRDQAIHAMVNNKSFDIAAADAKTPELPPVETNYKPSNKNGTKEYQSGKDAIDSIKVPDGYKVELFASEDEFPNLANPVQLSFDDKGRLWVAAMPSYPHYRPGDPKPDDKLLIYEDTNNDGKADREIVFADKLHLPIGFEFAPEGVYVSQEPHLMLLRDTDGDDKADSREVVLTGFDTHDTHHAISAFSADPSGAFMMCEGIFLHSHVETPYGPVRGVDGGFYRFSPQRTHLEKTAQLRIPNPWGVAFDKWGQDFYIHTSGPAIGWMLPGSIAYNHGSKNPGGINLAPKGNAVRPTSGLEFVYSSHFPDEVQGDMILGNNIGFLGIKQHQIEDDGAGYKTTFRHNLMQSEDGNFRPVDLEFAPDGSLYVVDWQNMLIGHMQHNARDPNRDHEHGRIYRITYPSRDLVKAPKVEGASIDELLENLKHSDQRIRYRSRRELRAHAADKVLAAVQKWVAGLDRDDPNYEHHRLEGLWVTWGINKLDINMLRTIMTSPDYRARAAAVRVLRYNFRDFPDVSTLLMTAAADNEGRVRLEAIVAATHLAEQNAGETSSAIKVVESAMKYPLDGWMKPTADAALRYLQGKPVELQEEHPMPEVPKNLSKAEQELFKKGHEIYYRDGHCATCHQDNGEGLPQAGFPPIAKSPWVSGDPDRITKLTTYGLMGPLELHGVKYPGQVPMTPFGGLLDDNEMAAVITYVRNHFGNKASAVTPEQVAKVRKEQGQRGFYTVEEILKEHPLK